MLDHSGIVTEINTRVVIFSDVYALNLLEQRVAVFSLELRVDPDTICM